MCQYTLLYYVLEHYIFMDCRRLRRHPSLGLRLRKAHAIIAGMPEAPPPPIRPISALKVTPPAEDKMLCERCGAAEMYRMHAVWRCPECGFKTDCCGW